MTEATKTDAVEAAVTAIAVSDQLRASEGVLVSVQSGFKIASREDAEQAADTLQLLKRGSKYAAEALTEAFRPWKARERALRDMLAPRIAALDAGAAKVDAEMHRWRRAEEARVREEQVRAQAAADAAAKAAEAANATLTDDEEPLPPAQVVVPKVEVMVRGAVGKTHITKRVEAVEIVSAVEAAKAWPHVLKLDPSAAKAEYDILITRGTAEYPPEAPGVVLGGIRFVTRVINVSGRA